jgi:hypothetical protein
MATPATDRSPVLARLATLTFFAVACGLLLSAALLPAKARGGGIPIDNVQSQITRPLAP